VEPSISIPCFFFTAAQHKIFSVANGKLPSRRKYNSTDSQVQTDSSAKYLSLMCREEKLLFSQELQYLSQITWTSHAANTKSPKTTTEDNLLIHQALRSRLRNLN